MVASASELGTVIKVFSATDGALLYEFRRGTSYTNISSLTFRPDSKFLVVGSSNQTVHVFKLDDQPPVILASQVASQVMGRVAEWAGTSLSGTSTPSEPQITTTIHLGSSGSVSTSSSASTRSLVPKYFQSFRSFAQFKIPEYGGGDVVMKGSPISGPICAFSKTSPNHVFIVHPNGLLYEISFDESRTEFTQDCGFIGATAYFQSRPDFIIHTGRQDVHDDAWQVL